MRPQLNATVRARSGRCTDAAARPSHGPGATTIAATAASFVPLSRATSTDTADADLVAAVRRGDDHAFEVLYERYHRRIAGYIHGMVGDYGRAEDIAQDVFMSALRRMRETDRPIAFKPWVYEIAKNACIDQFRRARRAEEVSYDADEGLGAADHGRLVNSGPTPDVAVDQKMSIDHLRGAFGGLSDTHHRILVMRELEGLSYREIGERLGMSRPSVESTLFRARRRLSEEYEELVSGERCSRVQLIIGAASGGAVGTRDRRKLGKHVAHCQPCRRQARLAGVADELVAPRATRARLAAFLPLPAFLRRRLEGDDGGLGTSGAAVGHHAPALAQWSAQLSSAVDPALAGWAKAAAAAATIAVAGVGAGSVGGDERIDLRPALPGPAVTEALGAQRSAPAAPVPAAVQTPGSRSVAGGGPAEPVAAGRATDAAAPRTGTVSDATRSEGVIAPLLGGAGATTTSGDAAAAPLGLALSGGDPNDEPTGSRLESGEVDVAKRLDEAARSLPAPAATGPSEAGTRPDPAEARGSVAGVVGDAEDAVTGILRP